MSGPSLHVSYPPKSLLKFPPDNLPGALPPPSEDGTLASLFSISEKTYNRLLDFTVPATFALSYLVVVTIWNGINAGRQHKPWAISRTRAFKTFVLLHNIALALYSALTFVGLLRAVRLTWPGWHGEGGVVRVVDAFCKLHGPRGFGDSATYNSTTAMWETKNKAIHLGEFGTPDPTDYGRLWNEGLAFWGWLFYLSKFYEVVDTAIILAKGKRSSFLQTYHHAGALLCVWAGIRYMSPPIWVFVIVNSALHGLMYAYYALSGLGYHVPQTVKRTLTTFQILQFVLGALFAAAHLFISYDVPVSIPYTFYHAIQDTVSSVSAVVATNVDSVIASATEQASLKDWLKKMAFRAAGEEGLAENVRNERGQRFGMEPSTLKEILQEPARPREEIRYRNEYQRVHCLDTSGQAFAIFLNVIYLAPLTWLFVRFFIRSYTHRTSAANKKRHPNRDSDVLEASKDAAKGVNTHFGKLTKPAEEGIKRIGDKFPELSRDAKQLDQSNRDTAEDAGRGEDFDEERRPSSSMLESTRRFAMEIAQAAEEEMEKAKRQVSGLGENIGNQARDVVEKGKDAANGAKERAAEAGQSAKEKGKQISENVKEESRATEQRVKQEGKGLAEDTQKKASEAAQLGKQKAQEGKEKGKQISENVKEEGRATEQSMKQDGKGLAEDTQKKASDAAHNGKKKAQEGKEILNQKAGNAGQAVKKESHSITDDVQATAKDLKEKAKDVAQEGKQGGKNAAEETEEDIVDSYGGDDKDKRADKNTVVGTVQPRVERTGGRIGETKGDSGVMTEGEGVGEAGGHGGHDVHAEHEGLSSTSPKDLGESYAEVVKHHLAESEDA